MNVQTSRNNDYSYLRCSNEIVGGIVDDSLYRWEFQPLAQFTSLPNLDTFVIGITERCNLRCTYCCYSGSYKGNRTHSSKTMSAADIDQLLLFIKKNAKTSSLRIAFYGGEPLMNYEVVCYAIAKAQSVWRDKVTFSITTNGTLLSDERIEWLVAHKVELQLSVDGTEPFHDRYRKDAAGNGSFLRVYNALKYINSNHVRYMANVQILMTIASIEQIGSIAEDWHKDELLTNLQPSRIAVIAPDLVKEIPMLQFEDRKQKLREILNLYESHQDWLVLKAFLSEQIAYWKDRPIFEAEGLIPMSTCLPYTNKLYIDADGKIGVCEKFTDSYRVGDITRGINWQDANRLVATYYSIRKERCTKCPAVRMCDMCLTAVAYTPEQWNVLCHNERVHQKATFWLFCEMAEHGLLDTEEIAVFPKMTILDDSTLVLDEIFYADYPNLREIFEDEETRRFLPELSQVIQIEDGLCNLVSSFNTYQSNGAGYLWCLRKDGCLAGFIGIMDILEKPTLFYAMHPDYRGQRLMKKAALAVVDWFSATYNNMSLKSEVYKDNIRSLKLLESLGFVERNTSEDKFFLEYCHDNSRNDSDNQ